MNIQRIKNADYNPAFGIKLNTSDVLEVTTQKILNDNGIFGMKDVILKLNSSAKNRIGSRGYFGRAKEIGEKINARYPELKKLTDLINNAWIAYGGKTEKFCTYYKNLLKTIDKEIDITI